MWKIKWYTSGWCIWCYDMDTGRFDWYPVATALSENRLAIVRSI